MAEVSGKIAFEVVTPERRVLALDVDEVVLPSVEGYLGVLPGHAPLLAMLDVGEMSYRVGGERRFLTVTGGFAEILRGSVSVLAKASELPQEIDLDRAESARRRAEEVLATKEADARLSIAEVKLKRALIRIQVHRRHQG